MSVILSFDQGTTSSRAILFGRQGEILGVAQKEFQQHFPQPGWVEHDANEIWSSQLEVGRQVLAEAGIAASAVAAIGITNQRETTVIWDRRTGEPIHRAIVWQDRRTAADCESLIAAGHAESIRQKTGLVIDAYFCATKIRWLLDNVPNARQRAERGELAFGTIDSWLIWKLTGGRRHITDRTNASRTMMFNQDTLDWDQELLDHLNVPKSLLPEVVPSSALYDETDSELFSGPIKIAGAAGDQQAALFGQNCTRHGMAKNTYGTGCFMLMHIGDKPLHSTHQLLTSSACPAFDERAYALEGSVFIAGAAVQWLRDGLKIIEHSAEIESLAGSVPDSGGVYVVPAFSGLGAPHWDPYARGTIVGITRGTDRGHLARATLEGIAYQVADVFDAMKADSGLSIEELRVDGGACANDLLMQIQADIMQTSVVRPKVIETTALGAAYLAGLAVGFWNDAKEIETIWQSDKVFEPKMSEDEVHAKRQRWNRALRCAQGWEKENQ